MPSSPAAKPTTATRHLDLGCGMKPRNPYHRSEVHGVDLGGGTPVKGVEIRRANVAVDPIPYPDNHFDSVSAYDFLEHVPRVLGTDGGTRFPFVELMNEIWRVLTPGGLFYGLTPAYPHHAAFQDPTHVNILTDETHHYFASPKLLARMYGYVGDFEVIRVIRVRPEGDYENPTPDWRRRIRLNLRARRGEMSHLVWEFRAVKPAMSPRP